MATSSNDQSGYVVDIGKTHLTDDVVAKSPKKLCESDSSSQISNLRPWKFVCACLLLSTLFQSIKPSDPYLPKFFYEQQGITQDELTNDIFEYRTYTYNLALLPVSLLSEVLTGYAPVIIVGLFCRLATQFAHFYANGIGIVQLGYAMFGFSQATKIIYSAHLYRMVPLHVFHRVTGYLRAANLAAHVVGGSLGNAIIDSAPVGAGINWLLIFSISQAAAAIGVLMFILACVFSWRSNKQYEQTDSSSVDDVATEEGYAWFLPNESIVDCISRNFLAFVQMMRTIYSSSTVLVWSLWWCVGFAVAEAILDYQAVLFIRINGSDAKTGYIFAAARLSAAGAALIAGRSRSIVDSYGLQILSIGSILLGAILFVSSFLHNIYIAYACFILFLGLHEFCFCSSNAQVAVRIPDSMRGVALVSNTFVSIALQSLLQMLPKRAGLDIRQKYVVFAVVMAGVGVVILAMSFFLPKDAPQAAAADADGESASSGAGQAHVELGVVDGKKARV